MRQRREDGSEVGSMELQVAMDRLSIADGVRLAKLVAPYAD